MSNRDSILPALLGGSPIRPDGPPAWPPADPDVQTALAAAVASGAWGQYHGEHVCGLEAELAAFHGVPHALTCASGTLAVEAALRALRVGPGDEVVMAAYDYESNFLTVHAIGAKPVLVDVAPHNWNLDPGCLEAVLAARPKAVICSHLHGGLVPMREVVEIARRHGVGVVEDAAQAAGATVQGKPAGTWGDVGTLSFGGSKLLSAGRGGGLLFRDPRLFQRSKVWLSRGLQQWAPLSELQAAVLRPQLRKLGAMTTHRAERVGLLLGTKYGPLAEGMDFFESAREEGVNQAKQPAVWSARSASGGPLPAEEGSHPPGLLPARGASGPLSHNVPGLVSFENVTEDSIPAYYKVGFRYDPQILGLPRDVFVKAVRAEGVAFDAGFNALHVNRSPSRFRAVGELTHATAAHHGCVILHHPVLSGSADDVRQVADAVGKVYRNRDRLSPSPPRVSSAPG